jgi:hypothetical protein
VSSCRSFLRKEILASLLWRSEIQPLNEPAAVVVLLELQKRCLQVLNIVEVPNSQQLLFNTMMKK